MSAPRKTDHTGQPLEIEHVRPREGVVLIAFRGDLDTATCPSARAAIEDALEVELTRTLVLDFSRVHVFATAAAHLVNDVSTASERRGTDLRIVAGESRCIRRPLSMFGGGKTAMHDSRTAALRA